MLKDRISKLKCYLIDAVTGLSHQIRWLRRENGMFSNGNRSLLEIDSSMKPKVNGYVIY